MEAVLEASGSRSENRFAIALSYGMMIFLLSCACLFFKLGDAPLARTEGHRAITAHQMVLSGSYLVPTLYGHVYLRKPPLQYWAIALVETIAGPGEFSARLPAALSTALLAALVCLMTARWIDDTAGLIAGLACFGLVPLWSQARSADVDALNTLGAVAATLAIIDIGRNGRASPWIIALGGAGFGISLLTKGPTGLPIIAGAMIGPAIAFRTWGPIKRRANWIVLSVGILLFLAWVAAVFLWVGTKPLGDDNRGLDETARALILGNWTDLPYALAAPWMAFAYGLPVSAMILLGLVPSLNRHLADESRRLAKSLSATVLAAFAIQFLAGTGNARYQFINLPLLCPLAGLVAFAWSRRQFRGLAQLLAPFWFPFAATLYATATIVLLRMCWKSQLPHGGLIAGMAVSVVIAILSWVAVALRFVRGSAALATLAICAAAMAFGLQKNWERTLASASSVSAELSRAVTPNSPVAANNVVWSQPELFYYARVDPLVHPIEPDALPAENAWLVMDELEWAAWEQAGSAVKPVLVQTLRPFKHVIYVCWYSPTGAPPPTRE